MTCTGWHIRLYPRLSWQQYKSGVLVYAPYTETQFLLWCQQNLENSWMCHPVLQVETVQCHINRLFLYPTPLLCPRQIVDKDGACAPPSELPLAKETWESRVQTPFLAIGCDDKMSILRWEGYRNVWFYSTLIAEQINTQKDQSLGNC